MACCSLTTSTDSSSSSGQLVQDAAVRGVSSGTPGHLCLPVRRRHLEQPRPPASWASLTVHGFADSPVSWGGNEHGVLKVGENFYSLLMFHDQSYQLYLAAGAHDSCPP